MRFPIGTRLSGKVRNLTNFGAFVEIEPGIDGLVHISDLSWTKRVRHPSELVQKGDEVDVIVLGIDKEQRRISLGHKQTQPNPWDDLAGEFSPGTETTGTIVRLIDKGAIVDLPNDVEGFVPLQHLGRGDLKSPEEAFDEGDELPLTVIEFDREGRKIVLSVTEYFKSKDVKEQEAFLKKHEKRETTLADHAGGEGLADLKKRLGKEAEEIQEASEEAVSGEPEAADEPEDEPEAEPEDGPTGTEDEVEAEAETASEDETAGAPETDDSGDDAEPEDEEK